MIKHIRNQKEIERLSGKFKLRGYNLMEHSYMVLSLYLRVCDEEHVAVTIANVDAILNHDIVETITLDLPHPIKNLNEETKASWNIIEEHCVKELAPELTPYTDYNLKKRFTERQYEIFKLCDLLDLWMYCIEEQECGNMSTEIQDVVVNCESMLKGKCETVDKMMEEFNNG